MNKEEKLQLFKQKIALLPEEKQKEINQILHEVLILINRIEIRLFHTKLDGHSLYIYGNDNYPCLWCEIFYGAKYMRLHGYLKLKKISKTNGNKPTRTQTNSRQKKTGYYIHVRI